MSPLENFAAERRARWEELEELLSASKGRPHRLGSDGVRRFASLYRATAADLAVARRQFAGTAIQLRLEQLVSRAAMSIYGSHRKRDSLVRFFARTYWRRIAEAPGMLAFAWSLTLVPALAGVLWAATSPDGAIAFVPDEFRGAIVPPLDAGTGVAEEAAFSAELFTHNIQVSLLALALGIGAGLGTSLVLVYNGLLLGTIAGLAVEEGAGSRFAEFIVPHGPLELSCIAVTAAGGLRIGAAIIRPGTTRRGEALRREARAAAEIALGTMPWLVVAGLVEAFVRSNGLPAGLVALVGLGLLTLYWALVWVRGRPPATREATVTKQPGSASHRRARVLAAR